MKKIIVLVLTVALCVAAMSSCAFFDKLKNVFKNPLDDVASMYNESAPTRIVASTKHTVASLELNCRYELVTGYVDNMPASVYTVYTEELESVENAGSTDIKKPLIKTTNKITEAIQGIGSRINGGEWNAEGSIYTIGRGGMAINLDKKSVEDVNYEDNVLTFTVPQSKVANVLGADYVAGIASDVKITITDDGAVITSIELRYTLAGDESANLPQSEMVVKVEYTYDLEKITIS